MPRPISTAAAQEHSTDPPEHLGVGGFSRGRPGQGCRGGVWWARDAAAGLLGVSCVSAGREAVQPGEGSSAGGLGRTGTWRGLSSGPGPPGGSLLDRVASHRQMQTGPASTAGAGLTRSPGKEEWRSPPCRGGVGGREAGVPTAWDPCRRPYCGRGHRGHPRTPASLPLGPPHPASPRRQPSSVGPLAPSGLLQTPQNT